MLVKEVPGSHHMVWFNPLTTGRRGCNVECIFWSILATEKWDTCSETAPGLILQDHTDDEGIRGQRAFSHDDVIKWKHFPRYWPFVRGIHRSPVNSPHKGQWHGALMLSLICVWINGRVNNREAGDLRRNRQHYDVSVMRCALFSAIFVFFASIWCTSHFSYKINCWFRL